MKELCERESIVTKNEVACLPTKPYHCFESPPWKDNTRTLGSLKEAPGVCPHH